MIRCIIVDDEIMAHQILEQYIIKADQLTLVAKCRNAVEAFSVLQQQTIDLMFLDIEMPLLSGLDFLKTLAHPPLVILTTAYPQYALESYDLGVADYLLKPFSYERFLKALKKVLESSRTVSPVNDDVGEAIVIRESGQLMKVAANNIIYIEGSRDYIRIHTTGGYHLIHQTMKGVEEMLPSDKFIRIHKSYIVALDKVKILKTDSVQMTEGTLLPVGNNYKDNLKKAFSKNKTALGG